MSVFLTQMTIPQKARNTNQTSATFVAKIPTVTEPVNGASTDATGGTVFDLRGGALTQNLIDVVPYAIASNNQTFSVRVIKWINRNNSALWTPVLLCEVLCTCSSTYPGIAGNSPLNTELYADTIAVVSPWTVDGGFRIDSPAGDTGIAHFTVDIEGAQKIEVTFSTGSSVTSCNAEVSFR